MSERSKERFPHRRFAFASEPAEPTEQTEAATKTAITGKLTAQARLLLFVQSLFVAANALSGTFVNVYLWKLKNDFALIGWFAVTQQVFMALTFWIAGKWVKEHNKMIALRLGVVVAALFYLLVLLLGGAAVRYALPLGAVQGVSAGLFWLAFNVVYFEVTGPEDRDRFNGLAGLAASAAGMTAPWLSGWLIVRMEDAAGYRIIFLLSLLIFLAGAAASFFLKKRRAQDHYDWLYGFRRLADQGNPWRRIVPALAGQGLREGVFSFVIGLLVYIYTRNEMALGNFALVTSAVGLVSFWLTGRFLRRRSRAVPMLIGAAALAATILPFYWRISYSTLLLFGIGAALFYPLFGVPATSVVFDIIGRTADSARRRVEFVVLRELSLCAGRSVGILAFIAAVAFNASPAAVVTVFLLTGCGPLIAWVCLRGILRSNV